MSHNRMPDFDVQALDAHRKLLILRDKNLGNVSLTNGIEDVLRLLEDTFYLKFNDSWTIIYQDSTGTYDGVIYKDNHADFYFLGYDTLAEVLNYVNKELKL